MDQAIDALKLVALAIGIVAAGLGIRVQVKKWKADIAERKETERRGQAEHDAWRARQREKQKRDDHDS